MSIDIIKKILNETSYGLVNAGADAEIPSSLIQVIGEFELTKAITYTIQLSQILSALKAKEGDIRKKVADRKVLFISQQDVLGEMLKYCDGSTLSFNGIDEYRVSYLDFVTKKKVDVVLPIVSDNSLIVWEKALNNSQEIHRYKIYTKMEFRAVAHHDSCIKMMRKMDIDQKLIDKPKDVKGEGFESDTSKYLGLDRALQILKLDSAFVNEMVLPRNHRNMNLCDAQHYINEIMPVFRVGCDTLNYGYGYCYQRGLNRVQNRLLRWKILLMSIDKSQLADIVIYGASREAIDIYETLNLSVYNPQCRDDYERRGIPIVSSMAMRRFCLLDPFNTIWSEFDYLEDEDAKNSNYTSVFSDLNCLGRMVRGKLAGGTEVMVPGINMHYVPMVLHKFEYYMLPPDLITTNYYYGSNSKGVLIEASDLFCRSEGSANFKKVYVSPFWLVYLSNLVRNKSFLEFFEHETIHNSLRMSGLMYGRIIKNHRLLRKSNRNDKADDSYVNMWVLYYQFMFRIFMDAIDNEARKDLFDDDTGELCVKKCVEAFQSSSYRTERLFMLYSANRISTRRQNYDKPQEISLLPNLVENESGKIVDTRVYLNHSVSNVASYSLLNKYPLRSRKDDVFLDLNKNTDLIYDKLDHMKVTFKNQGKYSDEVLIRAKNKKRKAYNGSVITSKPLLRVIRQRDRSDFDAVDYSQHNFTVSHGSRGRSFGSPVVSYKQEVFKTIKSKNFYGVSHNAVGRSGIS